MRIIFIILSFLAVSASAQITQPSRYEIERNFNDESYTVVSAGEYGVILFRDNFEFLDDKEDTWQFIVLDTTLSEHLNFNLEVKENSVFLGYEVNQQTFYLLFQEGYASRSNWIVNTIDLITGNIEVYTINNELDIDLTHFIISGNSIVLGGEVESKPIIVLFSKRSGKVEVLPGFFRQETTLVELKSNRNGTFNIVMMDENKLNNENIISVIVYSESGVELLKSSTNFGRDLKIQTGTISELRTEHLILIGTYGDKGSKLSKGFYFINVKPGTNNQIMFTEFTKVKSIFDFLTGRRKSRVMDKIKESTAQNPYYYKLTMAIWEIVEENNSYSVHTEIIDPQYGSAVTRNGIYQPYIYNPWYMPRSAYYRSLYSINDPDEIISVKYREALLVSFDKNGHLTSDYSLPISEVIETANVRQVTTGRNKFDNAELLYKVEDKGFRISLKEAGETIVKDSLITIKTLTDTDELKDEEDYGRVVYWYDRNYFVFGNAKIQDKITKQRRSVFYINKINIE